MVVRHPPLARVLRVFASVVLLAALAGKACTVFVLTDGDRTLFFNNEDWSNPAGRLWFVPAGKDYLGCAYVGFDDGWAQGGVNTAGLAFDWVAGAMERYTPDPSLKRVRGNASQRMLETCTTVYAAIAFFRAHRETEFARARILIADRSGASVIIGARDGALHFERDTRSRGFGYGGRTLQPRLASSPEPTVAEGAAILRACVQPGATPTQYANIFDLHSGEIVVYPDPTRDAPVRLDLAAELAKGAHAYDLRELRVSPGEAARPLRPEQRRFHLDEFVPLENAEPALVARLDRLLRAAAVGELPTSDYAPEFLARLAPARAELRAQLDRLGPLRAVTLVRGAEGDRPAGVRCIAEFSGARVLQRYEFGPDGKITALASEFVELHRP